MDSPKWNVNLDSHALSGKKSADVSYQYENGSFFRKHLGELCLHPIINRQCVQCIEGNDRARSDDLVMCLKCVEFVLSQ